MRCALTRAGALARLAVGTFGPLGSEPDPLAGVYRLPSALGWSLPTGAAPGLIRPCSAIVARGLAFGLLAPLRRAHAADPRARHGCRSAEGHDKAGPSGLWLRRF